MCRNVQITLGINLRPSPIKALTHLNFLMAPQTKNGNHFFLPTSQKIDRFIDFFLIIIHAVKEIGDGNIFILALDTMEVTKTMIEAVFL